MNFLKKKLRGTTLELALQGMHCASCSMNIDFALEDLAGVLEARTQYASHRSTVMYDPNTISEKKIISAIKELGYSAVVAEKDK